MAVRTKEEAEMTTEGAVKETVRMARAATVAKMASRNARNPKEDEDRRRSRKPLQQKRRRPILPPLRPLLRRRLLLILRRRSPLHRSLLHQHLRLPRLQLLQQQPLPLPLPPQLLLPRPEVAGRR